MADFAPALTKTLQNEGKFCHNPEPPKGTGEVVMCGVNHWTLRALGLMPGVPADTPRSVPASDAEVEFVRNLKSDLIESIYRTQYWDKIRGDEIHDQALAEKVFDVHVNTGRGGKMLQRAYNRLSPDTPLKVDGAVGGLTIAAVNGISANLLLDAFRSEAEEYYRSIPDPGHNLVAWLDRLKRS